jgi:peptidoglycan/xylan/chitin deacetylase (PgdA/CDA1 family)
MESKIEKRLAAIAYHEVCPEEGHHKYAVREASFERQMRWLVRSGCRCLGIDEMWKWTSEEKGGAEGPPVLVTFDDGHVSHHDVAHPLLDRHGIRGTFFVTTDWIGTSGYMDRAQLTRLHEGGMCIHSHGKSHRYLNALDTAGLREELGGSKGWLEDLLGSEVWCVSFPGGRFNERVLDVGRDVGYRAFVSSDPYVLKRMDEALLVGRVMIKRGLAEESFRALVACRPARILRERFFWYARRVLRSWIGDRAYGRLWRVYAGKSFSF